MAPRADVRAPLVMERLLVRDPALFEQTSAIAELARRLPASWQRLVSAELSNMEAQLIYERFVGVTLRDLSGALRNTGRVLPLEVLRTVIEHLCDGLAGARCEQRAHPGRDRQPRLVDAAARTAAPQARADAPHSMGRGVVSVACSGRRHRGARGPTARATRASRSLPAVWIHRSRDARCVTASSDRHRRPARRTAAAISRALPALISASSISSFRSSP